MVYKIHSVTITALVLWLHFSNVRCVFKNHQTISRCTFIVHPICPDPLINFYLYTRENEHHPQRVALENITKSYYVKSLPNKFIVHGFNSNMTLGSLQRIKDEYLTQMDVNVWMLDYSGVSAGPVKCYLAAVFNLPSVGLDPALPLFYSTHLNRRLSRNDAEFVDVIHTNVLVQGQLSPCGDVDFYVNGGLSQPGCNHSTEPFVCDHHMAPAYFAESINSITGFWSWPCPSVFNYLSGQCPPQGDHELMGENVNESARGQYVLHTNNVPPYAQGDWK
ncbi:lipase member H-A-like isoform X4 [Sipha flava]|uniref:Lipase member H-A-like isoform X4 n=1 Tax=Sipha flava TaxID=143950 RepID=A0A8B8GC01_9HEMI|nr:lipase member H-A-like isoform X4 [Sipha flava]